MGLSTLRTLRALGVIVSLFALLLLSSCEETDQNSSADQPAEPEGIVQAKVEDGQSYVALALAPKEPGGKRRTLAPGKVETYLPWGKVRLLTRTQGQGASLQPRPSIQTLAITIRALVPGGWGSHLNFLPQRRLRVLDPDLRPVWRKETEAERGARQAQRGRGDLLA